MGVEYKHYLIPKPNSFVPTPDQMVFFLEQLVQQKWVPSPAADPRPDFTMRVLNPPKTIVVNPLPVPLRKLKFLSWFFDKEEITYDWENQPAPWPCTLDWLKRQMEGDLLLEWYINDLNGMGVKYPLDRLGYPEGEIYYSLQIQMASDYIYNISECIEPLKNEACPCGAPLMYYPEKDIFNAPHLKTACSACGQAFDPSEMLVIARNAWSGEHKEIQGGAIYRSGIVIDCGKCTPRNSQVSVSPAFRSFCADIFGCAFYDVGTAD